MKLPKIDGYLYNGNYGTNALRVDIGRLSIWFSYQTPVAFDDGTGTVCRVNDWKQTTGKHLNAIEPNHKSRVSGAEFENRLCAMLAKYGLEVA